MTISTEFSASTAVSTPSSRPPPPPGGDKQGEAPSHANAIEKLGSSLSDEVRSAMLASVEQMEEDGASFEEIKSFVDSELEANGVDIPEEGPRRGQLVDLYS